MASFGLTLSRSCIYRKTFDSLSCLLAVSILTISTCGCSNPYSAYYQDLTNGQQVVGAKNMQPETVDVRVVQGGNVDEDTKGMMREGYIVIGVSAFNAGAVNPQGAKRQAQKVGAEVVIVYNQYTNTVSGVMPFQQPTTQTSTTYHSGSVYGYGGGMATFSGTSQTTTYGSQTTYIPYNVDRYDYLATYWTKAGQMRLGVRVEELTDEMRQRLKTNKGVYVTVVVKRSPAFAADVIEGDIITKIDGTEVLDGPDFVQLINRYREKEFTLTIYRDGQYMEKHIPVSGS